MTVPYKVKSIQDNTVIGIVADQVKEFKTDVLEEDIKVGDYFLAQNGYVLQIIPKQDADNLMNLFN
ncbi:MAG: HypC/HybG/HupF family hydrogenase formation chaperone [Candidatus Komeilibacteria bacterium]